MLSEENVVSAALRIIRANHIERKALIAAPIGPGGEHKEYLHVWPRDALLTAIELKHLDPVLAESIARSVLQLPTDRGLFFQRYELSGHPDPKAWCNTDGSRQLDQDALRFIAMSEFPGIEFDEIELVSSYFSLLKRLIYKETVCDVWEQKRGYFFYSTAILIWGLKCAERLIPEFALSHEEIVGEMLESVRSFYDEGLESYVKGPSDRIIDLEVILGLNVLFQSGLELFETREGLEKVLSTLDAVEREICVDIGKVKGKGKAKASKVPIKVPIRYKDDFWDGERVGSNGIGRPWPMGAAMIAQTYSHVADAAFGIGEDKIASKALKSAKKWLDQVRRIPHIDKFPEQIAHDGSLPELTPRPLTWCASEIIKAKRLYAESENKIGSK